MPSIDVPHKRHGTRLFFNNKYNKAAFCKKREKQKQLWQQKNLMETL